MARYETYQSNEAEAPVMRKWLVCAFFLSLALHAALIVAFRMKTLDRFGHNDAPRLAPPTEILTRVKIPRMPDEDTHTVLHSGAAKASKFVIQNEKPVVEDVKIQTPLPDFLKSIAQDKPKAEASSKEVMARVEAASNGAMEKELNSLAGNLIKESSPSVNQPRIKVRPSSKTGNGLGDMAGIPGRLSLDEALNRAGALTAGTKPIGVPGGALYEFDSADLKPEAQVQLQKLGELIRRNPKATFSIEGHTDSFGTEAYNLDLSLRRAESVKSWLIQNMGIAPERIETKGLGNSHPIVSAGKTQEEQAPNRRVEIVIHTGHKK
jgi:outer membrane protein OmpA-like peptidoglycan-associated protein